MGGGGVAAAAVGGGDGDDGGAGCDEGEAARACPTGRPSDAPTPRTSPWQHQDRLRPTIRIRIRREPRRRWRRLLRPLQNFRPTL